jgi:hypothetical protein
MKEFPMRSLTASFFAIALFFSLNASAMVGEFTNLSDVPSTITDVQLHVFNAAGVIDCGDSECFRIDTYLNGVHVARWGATPGTPYGWSDFKGSYTPLWNDAPIYRLEGANYHSHRGDSMPYAMFIRNTGFAVHGHNGITGRKGSHGCVRIETPNAKVLNGWMRKAINNGGGATITTEDTKG